MQRDIRKPNPYISVFLPFPNLKTQTESRQIKLDRLGQFKLKNLLLSSRTLDYQKVDIQGKTPEERIYSIFLDPKVRLGDAFLISKFKNLHIENIKYFTSEKRPIEFCFLGFPYKMPNPLKTNRELPDLGEAAIFLRFFELNELIKRIYPPGAIFTIFLEGKAFITQDGVSLRVVNAYYKHLRKMLSELGWENLINLVDLESAVLKSVPNFNDEYQRIIRELERDHRRGNTKVTKMVQSVLPMNFACYNSLKYKESDLIKVYNLRISEKRLLPIQKKIRAKLMKEGLRSSFEYLAYHEARKRLNAMKVIAPNMLRLTVSPKVGSLGINAINKNTKLLPYRGVPVLAEKGITVEYLIRIKSDLRQRGFIRGSDKTPFFYSSLSPSRIQAILTS